MKNYIKYIISTIVFFITFTLIQFLLYQSIDWVMIIITTVIYGVVNALANTLLNK